MQLYSLAAERVEVYVQAVIAAGALYAFLGPIIAKWQGNRAPAEQRTNFQAVLDACGKQIEVRDREIERRDKSISDRDQRIDALEAECATERTERYKAESERYTAEAAMLKAGWQRTETGWRPSTMPQ